MATTAAPMAHKAIVADCLRYQGRSGNQNASAENGSNPSSVASTGSAGSVGGSSSSTGGGGSPAPLDVGCGGLTADPLG